MDQMDLFSNDIDDEKYKVTSSTYATRRLEAFALLMSDTTGPALFGPLTREELDKHPITCDLLEEDKDAIAEHWPKFQYSLKRAQQVRALRDERTAHALKSLSRADQLSTELGMDKMTVASKLIVTARVFHGQIEKTALRLGAMDEDEVHSDPLSRDLYRNRVNYIKDFMYISRSLLELAERIREVDDSTVEQGRLSNELKEMLREADETLKKKAAKHMVIENE